MINATLSAQMSADEIAQIEQLHNDFDTASDTGVKYNELILKVSGLVTEKELEIIENAELCIENGLINTIEVKHRRKMKEEKPEIADVLDNMMLHRYYAKTYPYLKFLTLDELKFICHKHNLIYGSIDRYINSVPTKILKNLKSQQKLKEEDYATVLSENVGIKHQITIDKFELRKQFRNPILFDLLMSGIAFTNYQKEMLISYKHSSRRFRDAIHFLIEQFNIKYVDFSYTDEKNYEEKLQRYSRWSSNSSIYKRAEEVLEMDINVFETYCYIDNDFEFIKSTTPVNIIAAPKSYFDMTNMNLKDFELTEKIEDLPLPPSKPMPEPRDPVLLEKCRGGVLVRAKWGGPEASDPMLQNANEN